MPDISELEACKGKTIVFEGGEGCGKGTIAADFAKMLQKAGCDVLSTREPGGSDISERIRNLILDDDSEGMSYMAETLLYAASRAQLVEEVLAPASAAGKTIILDRFVQSSYVYQGIVEGVGIDTVIRVNEAAMGDWRPDLCFVLDVPVEVSERRIASRDQVQNRFDRADASFKENIRQGYLSIAKDRDDTFVIDATKSVEEVLEEVSGIASSFFTSQRTS